MKKPRFANLSIKYKFIISIVLILVIAMMSLSLVFIKQSEKLLIADLEGKAGLINRNLSIIAAKGIQENTFSNLQELINEVAANDQEIKVVLVAYPNGTVIASSDNNKFTRFSKIRDESILAHIARQKDMINREKGKKALESIRFLYSRPDSGLTDEEDMEDMETPVVSNDTARIGDEAPSVSGDSATKEPVGRLLGFIYIELDTTHLEKAIAHLWKFSTILALCMKLLGIISAYWLGTRMAKPIGELAGDVRLIASGNLDTSIQAKSEDELGQLVGDVEKMRLSIKDLTENLEDQVRDRTAKLERANDEIVLLNERLQADNLRMSAELDITRRLQQMILPTVDELKSVNGLDIAGYMEPADEVGGDYYDVIGNNGRVSISIGDVTGHGLESGVVMLMTQTAMRALLTSGESDPGRFLDILNQTIYGNVQRMRADKSLTLSVLEYSDGRLRLSGQHEQMIVMRKNGQLELVDTMDLGFPIGLEDTIADFISEKTLSLEPGDGVVLYTDGITEAENMNGEQYGLARLCEITRTSWDNEVERIKDAIIEDVNQYIGKQKVYDDVTLVVIKQKQEEIK